MSRERCTDYKDQCDWALFYRVTRSDWSYHSCGLKSGHDGPHQTTHSCPLTGDVPVAGSPGVWMLTVGRPVVQQ